MSQNKFVLFLVIALILFIIHKVSSKPNEALKQQFDAVGTIARINYNDRGRKWFYVDIMINGEIHSAQTDTYISVPADTEIGNRVSVKYHYTQNGKVRCFIMQEGFQRVITDDAEGPPLLLYGAIASLAIFLVMLVKTLLRG